LTLVHNTTLNNGPSSPSATTPATPSRAQSTRTGDDFYSPYAAQELARKHAAELRMGVHTYENVVYTGEDGYVTESEAAARGLKVRRRGEEW